MSLRVAMIADDLTGALDAGAPFAVHGLRFVVDLGHGAGFAGAGRETADGVCVSTGSREADTAEAAARASAAASGLADQPSAIVFKKIDSRMKGHVAAEVAAILAASGRKRAVLCPAIPDLGRVVADGHLLGSGVTEPIALAPLLAPLGAAVAIRDARTINDLDALAAEIAEAPETVMAVGARGLAQALARRLGGPAAAPAPPLDTPLLFAIGSRDPITRTQAERLADAVAPAVIVAPGGAVPPALPSGAVTLVITSKDDGGAPDAVAGRFADGLARIVSEAPPATLVVSGGETAQALLARLGIARIEVLGEALPGLPYARTRIGERQVTLITKSGGFGDPDTLVKLAGRRAQDRLNNDMVLAVEAFQGAAGTGSPSGIEGPRERTRQARSGRISARVGKSGNALSE